MEKIHQAQSGVLRHGVGRHFECRQVILSRCRAG
ncbi:Uncharacterised protein [Vibrio cholerae]|nr:Uncharacterised protein [Vibrio cholerae]CSI72043.1 Uncharacterised protein [Vibrio cholerae]